MFPKIFVPIIPRAAFAFRKMLYLLFNWVLNMPLPASPLPGASPPDIKERVKAIVTKISTLNSHYAIQKRLISKESKSAVSCENWRFTNG